MKPRYIMHYTRWKYLKITSIIFLSLTLLSIIWKRNGLQQPDTKIIDSIKSALLLEFVDEMDLSSLGASLEYLDKVHVPLRNIFGSASTNKTRGIVLGKPIPVEKAKHIMIITTQRSGSSFLGDILEHYPGTWYSYEPLDYIWNKYGYPAAKSPGKIPSAKAIEESFQFVGDVYKCHPERGFYQYASQWKKMWLVFHNYRLWKACEGSSLAETIWPRQCFVPQLSEQVCPLFPIRLTKLVRMRLRTALKYLQDPDLKSSLQLILLVRDPRGVMNSRKSMSWCTKEAGCSDPKDLCDGQYDDYVTAQEIQQMYPNKVAVFRYEDVATDPFNQTDRLLEFLNLPKKPVVEKFLEDNTMSKRNGASTQARPSTVMDILRHWSPSYPYSTKRMSSATVFAWKKKMPASEILEIQEICKKPMRAFGYVPMVDVEKNKNDVDFSPVQPFFQWSSKKEP